MSNVLLSRQKNTSFFSEICCLEKQYPMNSRGYQASHEKYQKNIRSLPSTEKKSHVTHVSKQRSPISIKIGKCRSPHNHDELQIYMFRYIKLYKIPNFPMIFIHQNTPSTEAPNVASGAHVTVAPPKARALHELDVPGSRRSRPT